MWYARDSAYGLGDNFIGILLMFVCQQMMLLLSFVGCHDASTNTYSHIHIFTFYDWHPFSCLCCCLYITVNLKFRSAIIHFIEWCRSVCWILQNKTKVLSALWFGAESNGADVMTKLAISTWYHISGRLLKWESKRKGTSIHSDSTWCVYVRVKSCWIHSYVGARVCVCYSCNLLCHFKQVLRRERKSFPTGELFTEAYLYKTFKHTYAIFCELCEAYDTMSNAHFSSLATIDKYIFVCACVDPHANRYTMCLYVCDRARQ